MKRFEVLGGTVFSQQELDKVLKEFINRPITLDDLYQARQKITDLYINKDYISCGAYIPPQKVSFYYIAPSASGAAVWYPVLPHRYLTIDDGILGTLINPPDCTHCVLAILHPSIQMLHPLPDINIRILLDGIPSVVQKHP